MSKKRKFNTIPQERTSKISKNATISSSKKKQYSTNELVRRDGEEATNRKAAPCQRLFWAQLSTYGEQQIPRAVRKNATSRTSHDPTQVPGVKPSVKCANTQKAKAEAFKLFSHSTMPTPRRQLQSRSTARCFNPQYKGSGYSAHSLNNTSTQQRGIGVDRGGQGAMSPKFLAYLVILCFEKRRPKH